MILVVSYVIVFQIYSREQELLTGWMERQNEIGSAGIICII